MSKVIKMPGIDGKMQALTTLDGAAKYVGVPTSSLRYYLMRGDLGWRDMGPYRLIDAEQAKEVLQKAGYKRREKIAQQV